MNKEYVKSSVVTVGFLGFMCMATILLAGILFCAGYLGAAVVVASISWVFLIWLLGRFLCASLVTGVLKVTELETISAGLKPKTEILAQIAEQAKEIQSEVDQLGGQTPHMDA